jgi:hypothetical protein
MPAFMLRQHAFAAEPCRQGSRSPTRVHRVGTIGLRVEGEPHVAEECLVEDGISTYATS